MALNLGARARDVGQGSRVRLRRGVDLPIPGAPVQAIEPGSSVRTVAILEDDFPGARFVPRVELNERVRAGQPVLSDRHDPQVVFPSPAAGRVAAIQRGDGRRVSALEVAIHGEERTEQAPVGMSELRGWTAGRTAERLRSSGDWLALRERPFGRIARPAAAPAAIFVRAMDSSPLAVDAAVVLRERGEDLAYGLVALSRLTGGPLHVCSRPAALGALPDVERLVVTEFAGPHPAGLVGTHVHRLVPVSAARHVWYTSYQDVIAIGHGLRTGLPETSRVVALAGPAVRRPRLIRTLVGASSEDLVRGELAVEPCRIVSGSLLAGRIAARPAAFLGRYHDQLCALPASPPADSGWWVPGLCGPRRVPWWRPDPRPLTLGRGEPGGFLPIDAFERAFPLRLPLAPLLRALLAGDADGAQRFGALELEEEDLALASFLCPARNDYGPLLRAALGALAERQA